MSWVFVDWYGVGNSDRTEIKGDFFNIDFVETFIEGTHTEQYVFWSARLLGFSPDNLSARALEFNQSLEKAFSQSDYLVRD